MTFQYEREDGVVTTTNIWYSSGLGLWRWTCTNTNVSPYKQCSGQDKDFGACYEEILDCIVNI